ncbi:MAG: DUF1565 domain-containing protein [Bacteroidetes bacterium]|nr:DUF1565 domain-containing protein [Bacteroidota bacterium]
MARIYGIDSTTLDGIHDTYYSVVVTVSDTPTFSFTAQSEALVVGKAGIPTKVYFSAEDQSGSYILNQASIEDYLGPNWRDTLITNDNSTWWYLAGGSTAPDEVVKIHPNYLTSLNDRFNNWTPPYYRVRAQAVRIIGGYTAFFSGWNVSSANIRDDRISSDGYDYADVEFTSSNAVVTAQYKYYTVTYSTTIPSGSWPMAGSVTIPSGVTLTGSSGATLSFPSGSSLTVNGALSGGGMDLTPSSGTWTGVVVNTSGASVANCTISEATLPLNISGVSSATISGVTINNSNFSSGEAVSVSGSSPTISDLTIDGQSGSANGVAYTNTSGGTLSNSTIESLGAGQGITIQGNSSPTISGNTIEHNYYHGIACWSDGTGIPDIESNTIEYNGLDGLMLDQSAAYLLNDQSSDNNVGIYCENGSVISTGGQSQAGGNTITNNTDGIGATTNSTVSFGDYTGRWYDGTCNSIYGNTTYNAYASNTSSITAGYDWWGQSPPDASKFWTDNSSSTIDYTEALSSQANCPISGSAAQEVTLSGKTISGGTTPSGNDPASLFQFARQAREEGEYGIATAAYRILLQDSISSPQKERALFRLFNVFQLSCDSTIHRRPGYLFEIPW